MIYPKPAKIFLWLDGFLYSSFANSKGELWEYEYKTNNRYILVKKASEATIDKKVVSLDNYRWKSHCGGLYKLPVAA